MSTHFAPMMFGDTSPKLVEAKAETNGSALLRMAAQRGGLAQIGVKRPADVARLRARLRSAGAALSAQYR